ncbi:MAG: glutamate 5-kinase [Omnitrophica WOR_2 bacterium RIFCSPLOWO2_12_FULL_51_8]|nr:MAG: glutamate 5-kinase [Omnitrophica WOR_2 bacterium RIFCSPLOWO2_12_FULL_51_8]
MKQSPKEYKRIVIKIGSSLLFGRKDKLNSGLIRGIVSQVAELIQAGKEAVLVSSGAIAMGMSILKLDSRPKDLCLLQAAAATGQPELMGVWRRAFREKKLNCAQVLLTWEDLADRRRYLNAKNTLLTLLRQVSIPVINENDTVSTAEIKFGDNDRLSALVAGLVRADLLIILSDVEGLWDSNKKIIPLIDEITPRIRGLACPSDKKACVGGMVTKLEAAKIVMDAGLPCVVACGSRKDIILSLVRRPGEAGTLFVPRKALSARDHWIAFGTKPRGKIVVDDGAKQALLAKKSLLSVGVVGLEGSFAKAEVVGLGDLKGNEFARGKIRISCAELEKIKGKRSDKEVIHRDDIVIL